jgi:haloalkane dehalogenase
MGKSDKPRIAYRIFDHIDYIHAFIEQLGLKKITLVLHGWGSLIGFHYAMTHPDKVARMAFFESHVHAPSSYDALSLPLQDRLFLLGDATMQRKKVIEENYFIETFLKRGTLTTLSPAVIRHYQDPFTYVEDRQVLWQYCQDLPTGKEPQDVVALINHYSDYLKKSTVPKLMMYAVPGFITDIETVIWCKEHLSHLTLVDLGDAMHFAQESKPQEFSNTLLSWLKKTCD